MYIGRDELCKKCNVCPFDVRAHVLHIHESHISIVIHELVVPVTYCSCNAIENINKQSYLHIALFYAFLMHYTVTETFKKHIAFSYQFALGG